jgi:hypothetical protein
VHKEISWEELKGNNRQIMHKWGNNIKMDTNDTAWKGTLYLGLLVGYSEHGNETLGSIKAGKFLYQQSKCSLMTKNTAL